MPRHKLDSGYTKIVSLIIEAFARLNATKEEWRVLMAVIRLTYGWSKKADVIKLKTIVGITGLLPANASRAKKSLLTRNILHEVGGELGVQKDYDLWVDDKKYGGNRGVAAPKKAPKIKAKKRAYGEFQNVMLTDDEYRKLDQNKQLDMIDVMSAGIKSKGYKYKDHYAAILNWARRAEKQIKSAPNQPKDHKKYTEFEDVK